MNKLKIKITMSALALVIAGNSLVIPNNLLAQGDKVIVKVEDKTEVVIQPSSEDDVRILEKYDFNRIFRDIRRDRVKYDDANMVVITDGEDSKYYRDRRSRSRNGGIQTNFSIDFGMNNYVEENGQFPDGSSLYNVKPWGSWYIGLFPIFQTRVAGPFYLQWGGGIDWYTFKYQNARTRITQTEDGLEFTEDAATDISPIKSKTSAAYLKARFIPVFDFSRKGSRRNDRLWNQNVGRGLRLGVGPYVGYRIDSWTKHTFRRDNNKKRVREKNNFHLENFRYGIRGQVGFRGIDVFVTYDLNQLYVEDKNTPNVNAFAFGITL